MFLINDVLFRDSIQLVTTSIGFIERFYIVSNVAVHCQKVDLNDNKKNHPIGDVFVLYSTIKLSRRSWLFNITNLQYTPGHFLRNLRCTSTLFVQL